MTHDVEAFDLERDDPYCLTDEEADRLLDGAPWRRLAVVGDSVAEGLGDPADGYRRAPWADRVAVALRRGEPALDYLNLGHRGLRAAEVRIRQLDEALAFVPDLAIVACGGNDMFERSFDADGVEAELAAMVRVLRGAGADVVTFGMLDISGSSQVPQRYRSAMRERMGLLAERTRSVAERFGALHADLTGHPARREDGLVSGDGLHLNMRGHAIVATETIRRLGGHLGRT